MSRSDVLEAIAEMDNDDLEEVIDMVKVRRRHISQNKAREFSVGDRVRVHDLRKTNEWAGTHEGVIQKINRKTANVNFPHPKYGHNVRWKVYLAGLEKVED